MIKSTALLWKKISAFIAVSLLWNLSGLVSAAEPSRILFKNVNMFDGVHNKLQPKMNVLVEGNIIRGISQATMSDKGATVIDGQGRTLMPGLIDGHAHIMINADYRDIEQNMDAYDLGIRSVAVVENFLMDGFTTVRDMGGPLFATQRAIDQGLIPGPRLYPSGAFLSQTSGHGDFRDRGDAGMNPESSGDVSNFTRFGIGTIADGVPEVLKATRTNLRNGATQIKIMAGGGGSSRFDPIDTTQYSKEEICAVVEAAKDWGTYVGAHIFTDRAINRALDCGVKSFEHGFFASKETYRRISKEGAYIVPQTWGLSPGHRVGDTLYCSGQLGLAADGSIPESAEAQFVNAFEAIKAVLEKAGGSFADVVETATGGRVEILLERISSPTTALAHIRASKSPKKGGRIRDVGWGEE